MSIERAVVREFNTVRSMPITTLASRKANEADRLRQAARQAVLELADYARQSGGKFVVFGSYVTDTMRFDSDLDVMLDFPTEATAEAWRFADDLCSRLGVPLDIHDARSTKPEFAARVRKAGLILE
jgi:predicted nucleotidyltransferase